MRDQPRQSKFRKAQKGSNKGLVKGGAFVQEGDFGLKALDRGFITGKQIEACRVAINRKLGKKGTLVISIFPHKPVSKKPLEVRMGKGKGSVDHHVAVIKPGRVLFELSNVSHVQAQLAFSSAASKLPMRTKLVKRLEMV